ncbi:hypothetical protein [Streptomyces prasinus]|uniref:hypothetical protein n=1 Tax=Streptomyces prasinus TaxID=67345 RepID=UPI002F427C18
MSPRTRPATGIETPGKPFATGGTRLAERSGQGFHGRIGDTRIVERAPQLEDFMRHGR